MWTDRWVAWDCETTGLGRDARIIEVAVVTFEDGVVAEAWSSLVDPGPIDWGQEGVRRAMAVNGIDPAALEGQPRFEQVVEPLLAKLAAPVWVAHNAAFDLRMLGQEMARLGRPPAEPRVAVCTKNLALALRPRSTATLSEVAWFYQVPMLSAHRAEDDARVCGEVFARMQHRGEVPRDEALLLSMQCRGASHRHPRYNHP